MGTAVIVLGGHRSGTSCIAGILHHLGIPMGEQLLGANPGNPAGHFEDVAFLSLNKLILGEDKEPTAWREPVPDFAPFREQYRALVAARNRTHDMWGVKDPRLCFVLPLLLDVHGGGVHVIRAHRHPASSARSLSTREGDLSDREAENIARAYQEAARESTELAARRGLVLHLDFDFVVENPPEAVAEIAHFIQSPQAGLDDRIERAVRFVDPALNHWRSPQDG